MYWMESNLQFFRYRLRSNVKETDHIVAAQDDEGALSQRRPDSPQTHREVDIRIVRASGKGRTTKEFDPSKGTSTAKDIVAAHR